MFLMIAPDQSQGPKSQIDINAYQCLWYSFWRINIILPANGNKVGRSIRQERSHSALKHLVSLGRWDLRSQLCFFVVVLFFSETLDNLSHPSISTPNQWCHKTSRRLAGFAQTKVVRQPEHCRLRLELNCLIVLTFLVTVTIKIEEKRCKSYYSIRMGV